jgi:hypothetical protein
MPVPPLVPSPAISSENAASTSASSGQASAQSAAMDAFTQFSAGKKRRLSVSDAVQVGPLPEKKRKGRVKQTKLVKDEKSDDKNGEDLMDVTT